MRSAVLLAIGVACTSSPTLDPYKSERAPLAVTRATLEDHVLLTGTLEAADSDELVVPRTRAWQLSVRWIAKDGTRVDIGDKLMEFDNSELTTRLMEMDLAIVRAANELASQRAKDSVAIADKELEVERQRVEVAKAELDAQIPASLLPRREFEQFKLALDRSKTAHASAVDDLGSARKAAALDEQVKTIDYDMNVRDYERTKKQLDALVLTAPRAGVLVVADHPWFGRKLQVSDMVQVGFSAVRVSNLDTMLVDAQLSDVDAGRIEVGAKASCVLDAYPDRAFECAVKEVSEIAREPSQASPRRFFGVSFALETTDTDVMRPGMSVRVDVIARAHKDAVVAPREALAFDDSSEQVRALLRGGGETTVEVGFCTARACAIETGLEVGQPLRYRGDAR